MTWVDQSSAFGYGSVLTSTQMQNLRDNLAAFAAGDSGAPQITSQGVLASNIVGQAQIKIASSYHDIAPGSAAAVYFYTSPGGSYTIGGAPKVGFTGGAGADYVTSGVGTFGAYSSDGSTAAGIEAHGTTGRGSYVNYVWIGTTKGGDTTRGYVYYIQASPPYDMGDGVCGKFMFALIDKSGNVKQLWVAPEAPWHNNGPTDLRPHGYDNKGSPFKLVLDVPFDLKEAKSDPVKLAEALDAKKNGSYKRKMIDRAMQQADMPLVPHPFTNLAVDDVVVLIDPVSDLCHHVSALEDEDGSDFILGDAIQNGYIKLDNVPLSRVTPPGVQVVAANWKRTRKL